MTPTKQAIAWYPLDSPEMPPPGPNFASLAEHLAQHRGRPVEQELETLYRAALRRTDFKLPVTLGNGTTRVMPFVPGHIWGDDIVNGPRPAQVMVVGKCPGEDELLEKRCLIGPTSQFFLELLNELEFSGVGDWYVTNVLKCPPPEDSAQLKSAWLHDQALLLQQELRLVRPRYLLCLGADAVKAVLGKNYTLKKIEGRVIPLRIPLNLPGEPEVLHEVLVAGCLHPAYVFRESSAQPDLTVQLRKFRWLLEGKRYDLAEEGVDYRLRVDHEAGLVQLIREMERDLAAENSPYGKLVGVDAEWHGRHPQDDGSYVRTFQVSWAPKKAANIVFREAGGQEVSPGWTARAVELLREFFRDKRPVGHYFMADLPWLISIGLDLRDQYDAPHDDPDRAESPWDRCRYEGGLDTALMLHALDETSRFGLENLVFRFTTMPPYWVALEEWFAEYKRERAKQKLGPPRGFGDIPEDILLPYAAADADAPRRAALAMLPMLARDRFDNPCWEAFWRHQRCVRAIVEIHTTGITIDRGRVDFMTEAFQQARDRLMREIQEWAHWPDFNIRSTYHVREFLFGHHLNGKKDPDGTCVRIRPDGARTLNLVPVISTGKRPKLWPELAAQGVTAEHNPSTNKLVLSILAQDYPEQADQVQLLRSYRFVDQVLKSVLREPVTEEDENDEDAEPAEAPLRVIQRRPVEVPESVLLPKVSSWDDEDYNVYHGGIASAICSDGRVRTRIAPTKETGRWSSYDPPMMNLSSQRDKDYLAILGDGYRYKLRSMIRATPHGHPGAWCDEPTVLLSNDFKGAELCLMAWMANDPAMIEDVKRNLLPEDHPDYRDIHSGLTVEIFKLPCAAKKKEVEAGGWGHLRTCTKCVVEGSRLHTEDGLVRVENVVRQFSSRPLGADRGCRVRVPYALANHCTTTPLVGVYNGGVKPCLRVTTKHGYQLESTYQHRYWVLGSTGELDFVRAGDLRLGDWVVVRTAVGPFGNQRQFPRVEVMPRTSFKDITFPKQFTKDWAAFLGLYLAEGSSDPVSGSVQIALARERNAEFADSTERLLRRLFGARVRVTEQVYVEHQNQRCFRINSVKLARWLGCYCPGDSKTKTVPEFCFQWPKPLLQSFLRWFFEGDGTTKNKQLSVNCCSASEALIGGIQQLLLLFGVVTTKSSEKRNGYAELYHYASVVFGDSFSRFARDLGFVTPSKNRVLRRRRQQAFRCDRRVIPHQVARLRQLLPFVRGPAKEKCRECTRVNSRINLSPSRLDLILASVDTQALSPEGRTAYEQLQRLPRDVSFQPVASLTDLGEQQVYDVQTTDEYDHLVSYNGLLTHQTVVFGVGYGRMAKAICLALREQKIAMEEAEAQKIIDGIFARYSCLEGFFDECRRRSAEECWEATCFGTYRRTLPARERGKAADLEREFMNFPIQGSVAEAMNQAFYNFSQYREWTAQPDLYRLLLQNHDAALLEVPVSKLRLAVQAIRYCMQEAVPIYPTTLGGALLGTGPYRLGVDIEIYEHWGEKLTNERAAELGFDLEEFHSWL
jgi:uracil-DNA glycosylase family 4